MAAKMKPVAFLTLLGTIILAICTIQTGYGMLLTAAITLGTMAYHLNMRLLVGLAFSRLMRNRANYSAGWYHVGRREAALYEKLKVRQWKHRMPTYDSASFDPKLHSWDEIAQAMCQAELVHETNMVLSFLPIAAGIFFGAYPVFIITSVLAALFDLIFVIMQRYNRPRIVRLVKCKESRLRGVKPHS